ncbi:Scr1 family TA system antitoxin-like transcriptional regulator [Saccharothrix stipae]
MESHVALRRRSAGTPKGRELGEELRRLRLRHEVTLVDAVRRVGWTVGKLSKLEGGTRGTGGWELAAYASALGADDATLGRIQQLLDEPATGSYVRPHPQWVPDDLAMLARHEHIAATVTSYDPPIVPALLQTEDYACIALAQTHDVDLAVRTRVLRQRRFRERGPWCGGTFFVHEGALPAPVDKVGHEPLMALAITATTGGPGWVVRLIPHGVDDAGPRLALRQPFTVMTFPDPIRPLVYTEAVDVTVFAEIDHGTHHTMLADLHRVALTPQDSAAELLRRADSVTGRHHQGDQDRTG